MDKLTETQEDIRQVAEALTDFLLEKNKRYGNSALAPIEVFTTHIDPEDRVFTELLTRLDDKLSRIKNAFGLRKNDVADLIGYLMLVCVNKGWDDFSDLLD